MKLAVIGGGSTYTPELIDGILARRDRLPITEIVLVDPDLKRVDIVGNFAQRMISHASAGIKLSWSDEIESAVYGSDFVVSQFRVGSQAARDRDEHLGREFGLIGQETVGVGGFAKALRTIPVALKVADAIRKSAPDAFFVNFTNPAGLITETLKRHASDIRSVGLCNVPWNVRKEISNVTHIASEEIDLDYVGLNHLSWVRGVTAQGNDLTEAAFQGFKGLTGKHGADHAEPAWEPGIVERIHVIPNYYLMYYLETKDWLEYQKSYPTRASKVAEIEAELLRKYSDVNLCEKPAELMERGGAYYSDSAAELMADIATDSGAIHIVNTRIDGAVPGMNPDVVMEVPAIITKNGARAIPTKAMSGEIAPLVQAVKNFELLTIEAALSGDESLAKQALLANPLGPSEEIVDKVWDRLRVVHQGLLGKFNG